MPRSYTRSRARPAQPQANKLILLAALTAACTQPADDTGAGTSTHGGTTSTTQPCDGSGSLQLTDAQNYTFDGSLAIQSAATAGDGIDLAIDFSAVTIDLQGHDLDPTLDIESANVVVFRYLSETEVQTALSTNSLLQTDISLFGGVETQGRTSLNLSEFTLLGNDIDIEQYFIDGYGTWLLTLNSGTIPGIGTRMAQFLEPNAGTATSVALTNDSTTLTYAVDLQSLSSPTADAGTDMDLSWSALTAAGGSGDFGDYAVDQALVGHYTQTPAELESSFLDLELITDDLWHFPVAGGDSLSLSSATSEEGDFPGFSSDGTWVLALQCTTCANPAPPYLTIVSACEQAD